jgi:hypothetical protein
VIASPNRDFDDATIDRTGASFDNLDYVAIVSNNYRTPGPLATLLDTDR